MSVMIYLLSLPLAVWSLASLYFLIDDADAAAGIVRISIRCLVVLTFVYLVGPQGREPVLWGFLTVIVLHLGAFAAGRWLILRGGFNVERID